MTGVHLAGRRENRLRKFVPLLQARGQRHAAHAAVLLYSVWALPASQPRTTHSIGTIFTLRQIMQRPRSMSRSCVEISATRAGSVEIKWSAIIFHSRIRSNQRTEISVSNFPFSAIALGSTTSNALMRSVATTRILGHAPAGALRSYTSRTLPARLPGSVRVVLVTLSMDKFLLFGAEGLRC